MGQGVCGVGRVPLRLVYCAGIIDAKCNTTAPLLSARSHADAPPASPPSLQVRKEMQARVPVTPPESAEWLGRMMAEIWAPFVGPLVLKENLGAWQVGGEKGGGAGGAPLRIQESLEAGQVGGKGKKGGVGSPDPRRWCLLY